MTFPSFCRLIGLDLEPFQRKIATAANGPERQLAVLLSRGNGKTALTAAYALWHLIERPGHVYAAAASREQARILYEYAAGFARLSAIRTLSIGIWSFGSARIPTSRACSPGIFGSWRLTRRASTV